MKNISFVFLIAALSTDSFSLTDNKTRNYSINKLNVLLAAPPFAGHVYPLLALGEELVRHGHNVSFCSLDNWINLKEKTLERGMEYLSAGKFLLSESQFHELYLESGKLLSSFNPLTKYQGLLIVTSKVPKLSCDPILYYLKQQGIQQWDIVLLEYFLSHSLTCLATYSNVRTVAVYDRITYNYPPWPYPEPLSGKTDNLNFVGRLKSTLIYSLPVVSLFELFGSTITTDMCKNTFIGHNLNVGSFLSL